MFEKPRLPSGIIAPVHERAAITVESISSATTRLVGQRLARETVAVVLAGGRGARLGALTDDECKPALPFAGCYRTIDFSLSNCINSGIQRIGVATQYKDASLLQHLSRVWRDPDTTERSFVEAWRAGGAGYCGTADAVYRNWTKIDAIGAQQVLVLAGDHVYRMDYGPMLVHHQANAADVTVGCVEVPLDYASQFGVMSVDNTSRISRFWEKPCDPQCLPDRPDHALVSMGIYVFKQELLGKALTEDASEPISRHDFGHDLIPYLLERARVFAYPFTNEAAVGAGYWRDVGTIPDYWRAHMEILDAVPGAAIVDSLWPVRSAETLPNQAIMPLQALARSSFVENSVIAGGCVLEQAKLVRSVLFPGVRLAQQAEVSNAVLLPNATVGRHCKLTDVIVGPGVHVPDGCVIGPGVQQHSAAPPVLITAATINAEHAHTAGLHRIQRISASAGRANV